MFKKQIFFSFFIISAFSLCSASEFNKFQKMQEQKKEFLQSFITEKKLNEFKVKETKKFEKLLTSIPPEELIPLNKYIIHALRFHFFILSRELYSYYRKIDTDAFTGALKTTRIELKRLEQLLISPAAQKFLIKFDKHLLKFSGFGHRDQIKLFYIRTFFGKLISSFYKQLYVCEKMFFENSDHPLIQDKSYGNSLSTFWLISQRLYEYLEYTTLTTIESAMNDPEIASTLNTQNFNLTLIKSKFPILITSARFKEQLKIIEEKLSEEEKKTYHTEFEKLKLLEQEIDKRNKSSLADTLFNISDSFDHFFSHAHLYLAIYDAAFKALKKTITQSKFIEKKDKEDIKKHSAPYQVITTLSSILIASDASKKFFDISFQFEKILSDEVINLQKLQEHNQSKTFFTKINNNLAEISYAQKQLFPYIKKINEGFYALFVELFFWCGDKDVPDSIYPKSYIKLGAMKWSEYLTPFVPLLDHVLIRNRWVEKNRNNDSADKKTKELLNNQTTLTPLKENAYGALCSQKSGLPNNINHQAIHKFIKTSFKKPNIRNKNNQICFETLFTSCAQCRYLFVQLFKSKQSLLSKSLPQLSNNLTAAFSQKIHDKSLNWNNKTITRLFHKFFRSHPNLFATLNGSQISDPLNHVLGIDRKNFSPTTTITLCPVQLIIDDQVPEAYTLINNQKKYSCPNPIPQQNLHAGLIFSIHPENALPTPVIFNETISRYYPLEALMYEKKSKKISSLISEQWAEKIIENDLSLQLKNFSQEDLHSITEQTLESLNLSLLVTSYFQLLKTSVTSSPSIINFNDVFAKVCKQRSQQEKKRVLSSQIINFLERFNTAVFNDVKFYPSDFANYVDTINTSSVVLRNYWAGLKQLETELNNTELHNPTLPINASFQLNDSEGKSMKCTDIYSSLFLEFNKYPYLFNEQLLTTCTQSILSKYFKTQNPPSFLLFQDKQINQMVSLQRSLEKRGTRTAYSILNEDNSINKLVEINDLKARLNDSAKKLEHITNLLNLQRLALDSVPFNFVTISPRYFTHYKALLFGLLKQDINDFAKAKINAALRFLSIRDIIVLKNKNHFPLIEKIFSDAFFLYGNYNDTHVYYIPKEQDVFRKNNVTPLIELYQENLKTKKALWNKNATINIRFVHPIFEKISHEIIEISKK